MAVSWQKWSTSRISRYRAVRGYGSKPMKRCASNERLVDFHNAFDRSVYPVSGVDADGARPVYRRARVDCLVSLRRQGRIRMGHLPFAESIFMKPNIQVWEIELFIPYELNAKTHDDAQIKKIAKSIKEFGWPQPIVVDSKGVINAGQDRHLTALSLGMDKVPVLVRDDLTVEQARALRLADNRVAISKNNTNNQQKELASLD